jgi:hypothetical protein
MVLQGKWGGIMTEPGSVSLLQLSCCEASRLASEALDRELTRRERWALRIHSCLCSACRRFSSQVTLLRKTLAKAPESWQQHWQARSVKLSAQRRETIKRLLSDASRNDAQS